MQLQRDSHIQSDNQQLSLVKAKLYSEHSQPLSFTFQAGTAYMITGSNGAGKSTLLDRLAGVEGIASGSITLGSEQLSTISWRGKTKWNKKVITQIQHVSQHVEDKWFCGTVQQELTLIRQQYRHTSQYFEAELDKRLHDYGITEQLREQELQSLSVGQQKRLALAIAFTLPSEWLLLDEPFAGLDHEGKQQLLHSIAERKNKGKGLIVVSHQIQELSAVVDRRLILDEAGLRENDRELMDSDQAIFNRLLQHEQQGQSKLEHSTSKPALRDHHARERLMMKQTTMFDPRALMLGMLISSISLVLWDSWLSIIIYGLLSIITTLLLRHSMKPWIGLILAYSLMSLVFTIVGGLSISPLAFDMKSALHIAQRMIALLIMIVLGLPLLSLMTPFRLQRALQQSLRPLRKLRIPIDSYALLVSLIFRLVPILSLRWQVLSSLCRTRFKQSGMMSWSMMNALMLAYMRSLLQIADQVATSLEFRGFDRVNNQSLLYAKVNWRKQDHLLLLALLAIAAINAAIHL